MRESKKHENEIENQKDAKRHLKNELEKNNMIDQDAKETVIREIAFLGDNIERFKMELRRIEKNAFGLDWVGTFPEDDVIDAKDHADMSEVKQKSISKKFYQNANATDIARIKKDSTWLIVDELIRWLESCESQG